tara:strand:+ start:1037 stop:1471 length:435 start_codon:yes stop_codon:yes gene_type:complete
MNNLTLSGWSSVLSEPVVSFKYDSPILESGLPLTAAQQRSVRSLLDNGIPEVIDVAAVKAEASRRILALIPAHKQVNYLARGSELLEIIASGGALTAEEEADRQAARAAWAGVSEIRAASNVIESQELPADYLALIEAFDAILV